MKLISACLVGVNCKYNGNNNLADLDKKTYSEYKKGKLIPVCPEQLGGLSAPREKSQIQDGVGKDVLAGGG